MNKQIRERLIDFSIKTVATLEEIEILYCVIGDNWEKLANACELLNKGIPWNTVKYNVFKEAVSEGI